MKPIFILLVSLGLACGASAQRGSIGHGYVGGGFHGGYHSYSYHPHYYAPRVYYSPGFYGGWGWGLGFGLDYGYGWGVPGWYGPWYYPTAYPPYYYGRGPMPLALDEEIRGIRSDYKAQIKDVKHDKALTHSEKKQKINELEQKRDAAVTQARHDFYNAQMRNRYGEPRKNDQNGTQQAKPAPGSSSSDDMDHPEYQSSGK
ncbi:MAG TPA: hypothetical protein VN616_15150 [Puia sp.]|nr:hypothetical protein [Puia sp.]